MSDVLEILGLIKMAKRIPLNQLALRSSQGPAIVTAAVRELHDRGLVHVTGEIPNQPAESANAADTVIEITKKGMFNVE